jgi:hypothetical protein
MISGFGLEALCFHRPRGPNGATIRVLYGSALFCFKTGTTRRFVSSEKIIWPISYSIICRGVSSAACSAMERAILQTGAIGRMQRWLGIAPIHSFPVENSGTVRIRTPRNLRSGQIGKADLVGSRPLLAPNVPSVRGFFLGRYGVGRRRFFATLRAPRAAPTVCRRVLCGWLPHCKR